MDAGFIQYLATERGFRPGDTIATKQQYDAMYKEYLKHTSGGGNYQPAIVNVPMPGSTNTVPAFMSSANSATLMKDAAPKVTYKPDADGNLYAIEGTAAAVVTNAQGQPIKVDPKSSRLEDLMSLMGQGGMAPEQEPGFFSRIFGGVAASPTPAPTPGTAPLQGQTNAPAAMPTPSPTPEQRTAGPAVPTGGTNAPAAAPTPAVFTAEQYRQMSGGQQLPPGDYADANGRPFSIR